MADNYYDILGVDKNASQDDIKKAYKKKAIESHPDKGGDEEAFKKINDAYQTLGDANKRKQYDLGGRSQGGQGGFNFGGFNFNFGGRGGNPFDSFTQHFTQRKRKEEPIIANLRVSLEDIYNNKEFTITAKVAKYCSSCDGEGGTERSRCSHCGGSGRIVARQQANMIMYHTCPQCHGRGVEMDECDSCKGDGYEIKREEFKFKVDHTSKQFVLAKRGHHSDPNNERGDVIINLAVNPHDIFTANGSDLEMTMDVKYSDLILGRKVRVTTISGKKIDVQLNDNQDLYKKLIVKNHGFKHRNGGAGNLMINLNLIMPSITSDAVKKLIEEASTKNPKI